MRIILLILLITGSFAKLFSQNVDTLYVSNNEITKEKRNFESYFVIKRDPHNPLLYYVNQYYKSNTLKRMFSIQSSENMIAEYNFKKLMDQDDFPQVGKDISYSEAGKPETEAGHNKQGKLEYYREYLDNGDTVYVYTEKMASYPRGDSALADFLKSNCVFPKEVMGSKVSGKVIVRFIINEKGEVKNPTVIRSLNPSCDKEAVRVTGLIPKFIPASLNGKTVKMFMIVPIYFRN